MIDVQTVPNTFKVQYENIFTFCHRYSNLSINPHFGIHPGKVSHILGYIADWEKYSASWDTLGNVFRILRYIHWEMYSAFWM